MTGFKTHNRHLSNGNAVDNPRSTSPFLKSAMRKRVRNLRLNRQRRKLLAYDDHTLSDIGFSRDELKRNLRKRRRGGMAGMVSNIHAQDMHPETSPVRR